MSHRSGQSDASASAGSGEEAVTSAEGLADALQRHTLPLHREAERSGILRDLLRGLADRAAYALLLRNLLPAYEALEHGLDRHRSAAATIAFARPEVYRSRAIRSDLVAIAGPGWNATLAEVPSATRYAVRIAAAAAGSGTLLLAHAYVRYLGDLNGGQILKRVLGRTLALGNDSLAFYDFPEVGDLGAFTSRYRAAFDAAALAPGEREALLVEAAAAFRFNIDLSEEVRGLAG